MFQVVLTPGRMFAVQNLSGTLCVFCPERKTSFFSMTPPTVVFWQAGRPLNFFQYQTPFGFSM
jgi:hypothetical protein